MANVDRPHGFTIIGSLSGGEVGRGRSYPLAAANSIIGIGCLITVTTAGVVDRSAASDTQIVGVAMEAKAASSGGYVLVCDDPMVVLEAQTDDGTGTCTALTDMFGNVNFVVTDATNGLSNMEIDEDSQTTTATLPLKVIGLYPDPNNAFGEFNRLVCIINNHVYKSVGVDGLT